MPHKEPVEKYVQRRHDEQHIGGGVEQALGLNEALAALEDDEGGHAEQIDLEIGAGKLGGAVLGDHEGEDLGRVGPERNERDEEQEQEGHHALDLQAHEVLVP